jgi:hypothetical protein
MMPEVLTESFCERCGTRYTFESAAPSKARRIGKFKTLSKGVRNWVLSDDQSLDEAMAAARSDEERELTTQQLDAFHSTFNFCMTCRQYTCGNCWNAAEGRCLTCAPNLGQEVLPAPFPGQVATDTIRLDAEAWPEMDLPEVLAGNGAPTIIGTGNGYHDDQSEAAEEAHWPDSDEPLADIDPVGRLAFLSGEVPLSAGSSANPATPLDAPTEVDATDVAAEGSVEAGGAALAPEAHPIEAIADDDSGPEQQTVEGRAATGAARTSDLLARFRPGQNIDAELAAFEAQLEASERAGSEPEPLASAEPEQAARAEPASGDGPFVEEPLRADAEQIRADAEPTVVEPVQTEGLPVAPAAVEDERAAALAEPDATVPTQDAPVDPVRHDRVEQPTWRIFAPDQAAVPGTTVPPPAPGTTRDQPNGEPQWPARPGVEPSPSMALFANPSRTSSEAMWAASAQEVVTRPGAGPAVPATAGVQPCANCGLSLSANARFCRRCGSRQG